MKSTFRIYLISGTAITTCGLASLAWAQQPPLAPPPVPPSVGAPSPPPGSFPYAIQQLPQFKGTVARYTLKPRGDVDGLLLSDGTEVHFPPHMSAQLVYAIKPGDVITVRGQKAYNIPLIDAVAISNDASGLTVVDRGPDRGPRAVAWADQLINAQGRVQAVLHGKRGEVNGAILEDGTILRLPPPEAERFAALLMPGQSINAQGNGLVTPLGRVIDVQAIGQTGMQFSVVEGKGGRKGRRPPPLAFAAAPPPPPPPAADVPPPAPPPAVGSAAPSAVAPPPPPPGSPPPPRP
jgi:hypothetical protein